MALPSLTVLSLEQAITLPFLTYRLACDGARVIRVENPRQPDPNRFVGRRVLAEDGMVSVPSGLHDAIATMVPRQAVLTYPSRYVPSTITAARANA